MGNLVTVSIEHAEQLLMPTIALMVAVLSKVKCLKLGLTIAPTS